MQLKTILTGALAALTLGGTLVATATPASAAPWGYRGGYHEGYREGYRDYDRHRNNGGAVLGAGILGLAVGAAIAGDHHRYYASPPPAYYYGPHYYSYYGGCHSHWRWDPYWRRYVMVEQCY